MIPVFQTQFHNESVNGNCMRASLASIFELDIDNIPKFEEMNRKVWRTSFTSWLSDMNLALKPQAESPNDDQFYITLGSTNRGALHCVVSQSNKMIHDPHPSQDGLLDVKTHWTFEKLN